MFEPISVVIPVYNSSSYISTTIQSVIDSYSIEYLDIVVVDDKSKDINDLKKVLQKYRCVRLIEKLNKTNAADSRNIGINLALYEKIFLLDADDLYTHWYIKERVDFMNSTQGGVFFGDFFDVGVNGRKEINTPFYNGEDMREYLFINSGDFRSSTISLNKKYYKGTSFDAEQYKHQDWGFGIRCYDNDELIIQHHSATVEICSGRHIQMSSKMNIKASEYFLKNYLENNKVYVLGFIKMHYTKAFLQQDKTAIIFFNKYMANISFFNHKALKIKILSLVCNDYSFNFISKFLSYYLIKKNRSDN